MYGKRKTKDGQEKIMLLNGNGERDNAPKT